MSAAPIPSEEVRARLSRTLGEGNYAIAYEAAAAGTRVIVRTHDKPARECSAIFGPTLSEPQLNAVWDELVVRTDATIGATALGAQLKRDEAAGAPLEQAAPPQPPPAAEQPAAEEPPRALPDREIDQPWAEREADEEDGAPTERDPEETDAELEGPHR